MISGFSKKIFVTVKNLTILLAPSWLSGFMESTGKGLVNLVLLKAWIKKHKAESSFNDYFMLSRRYDKRNDLYTHIIKEYDLKNAPFQYLEFGVSRGLSFNWWMNECKHEQVQFYGFDTFEGLPESWGTFKKGDMNGGLPLLTDERGEYIKGLFQDTLFNFLENHRLDKNRTIVHLDADLFSATLFVLSSIHKYLKSGDILLFDEFNVPNHEFEAFRVYEKAFGLKYKLVGAVNNYFQVALEIE